MKCVGEHYAARADRLAGGFKYHGVYFRLGENRAYYLKAFFYVVRALAGRCVSELGLSRLWIGHYDGNERSRRVAEKCGFRYHHTEHGKTSLLGDIRTEHFLTLTAEEFMQK